MSDRQQIVGELARLIGELKPDLADRVKPEARLQSDIGLASVDIIDLVIGAEDTFDITIPDDSTGDLMDATVDELARHVEELSGPRRAG